MVRLVSLAALCVLVSVIDAQAQLVCNALTADFSERADLSARTVNLSCTVANGGYIYYDRWYRIDVHATVTGWCKLFNSPECTVQSQHMDRVAVGSHLFVNAVSQGIVWGNNGVQEYDTCPATNCTPVGTQSSEKWWWPSGVGTHTYTAISTAGGGTSGIGPQYCNMGATYNEHEPFIMHATQCQPVWWMLGSSPSVNVHVPATALSLYVPSDMWDKLAADATKPARLAAAAWESALSSKGISITVVDTDCGSGPECIKLTTGTPPGSDCAEVQPASVDYSGGTGTGVTTGHSVMTLRTGYEGIADARLQRTIAHELGHLFGLNHYSGSGACTNGNSVMAPISDCSSTTGLTLSPTQNDILPSIKSTYGNGIRSVCGY